MIIIALNLFKKQRYQNNLNNDVILSLSITLNTLCLHNIPKAVVPKCSVRKGILRNLTKFTGKHLCQSIFLNKVAGIRPATLLKKRPWHRCFPVNFVKFLRTPFFTEYLWILLNFSEHLFLQNTFDGCFWHSSNFYLKSTSNIEVCTR